MRINFSSWSVSEVIFPFLFFTHFKSWEVVFSFHDLLELLSIWSLRFSNLDLLNFIIRGWSLLLLLSWLFLLSIVIVKINLTTSFLDWLLIFLLLFLPDSVLSVLSVDDLGHLEFLKGNVDLLG